MAYARTTWSDGSTAITAAALNNLEEGIEGMGRELVFDAGSFTVANGASEVVPAGLHLLFFQGLGSSADMYLEAFISGGWRALPSEGAAVGGGVNGRAAFVASDGTNARVRNVCGSTVTVYRQTICLSGVTP